MGSIFLRPHNIKFSFHLYSYKIPKKMQPPKLFECLPSPKHNQFWNSPKQSTQHYTLQNSKLTFQIYCNCNLHGITTVLLKYNNLMTADFISTKAFENMYKLNMRFVHQCYPFNEVIPALIISSTSNRLVAITVHECSNCLFTL